MFPNFMAVVQIIIIWLRLHRILIDFHVMWDTYQRSVIAQWLWFLKYSDSTEEFFLAFLYFPVLSRVIFHEIHLVCIWKSFLFSVTGSYQGEAIITITFMIHYDLLAYKVSLYLSDELRTTTFITSVKFSQNGQDTCDTHGWYNYDWLGSSPRQPTDKHTVSRWLSWNRAGELSSVPDSWSVTTRFWHIANFVKAKKKKQDR